MSSNFLVWLLLSTIWGSTWLCIKIGLDDLPPFTFAGVRFLVSVIPLLIVVLIKRPRIREKPGDLKLIAFTGFLTFGVNYGLVFWGENYISSGLTAILYTTHPLFGMWLAHLYLKGEPMTLHKITGVILGIVGVVGIFWNQLKFDSMLALWGAVAIVIASFGTAYAGIFIKRDAKHIDPLVITVGQMLVGMVPLLLAGLVLEGNPFSFNWTPKAWLVLLYLAFVGSALAFVLVYWLIRRIEVTKTQLIPLASTVIAVFLGWLVLDEKLSLQTILGALIILTGLMLTTFGYRRITPGERTVEGT